MKSLHKGKTLSLALNYTKVSEGEKITALTGLKFSRNRKRWKKSTNKMVVQYEC
jgi:hypothetical protein